MCARRLRRSSSRALQRKRDEIREQTEDQNLSEEDVTRIMRAKMPWWDWFVHDYARYWYALGAIAFDAFLGLWLVQAHDLTDALGIAFVMAVLVAIVAVEVLGFFRLWPTYMLFDEKR